jgi:hypothetical protein
MGEAARIHEMTAAEIARYRERGYLVPAARVSTDLLWRMRDGVDRLIAEDPARRGEHLVLRWGGGADALALHAAFLDFARAPELLDIVEPLIGPDIICWGAHVICKAAADGLEVAWHQDAPYWPIRPMATATMWIALDPSTRDNGCLRVIPGSQESQTVFRHGLDHRSDVAFEQCLDDARVDLGTTIDVELDAGQMSIHDAFMVHGSCANKSGARRAGLAIRYMPATSLYDRAVERTGGAQGIRQDMSKRPIYLLRGRDRAGNDFDVGQDRPFEVG